MPKPLCIDLFCGLGGWADGFLAEGWDVIGFDIERHDYGTGGYPGQLVLQDVLTLDGRQFKNAAVIVASPPCQAYSYRGMPWGALWREHNSMDDDGGPPGNYRGKDPIFNDLFRACFRIAREAGLPVIVENVKGAQQFVGRATWSYKSFFLWGDVPALMPFASGKKGGTPVGIGAPAGTGSTSWFFRTRSDPRDMRKNEAGEFTRFGKDWREEHQNGVTVHGQEHGREYAMTRGAVGDGVKQHGSGPEWFDTGIAKHSSRSRARKAASAQIAKIPFPLAQHIARVFKPYPVEPSIPDAKTN